MKPAVWIGVLVLALVAAALYLLVQSNRAAPAASDGGGAVEPGAPAPAAQGGVASRSRSPSSRPRSIGIQTGVTGHVTDDGGSPLPGATVSAGSCASRGQVDEYGSYEITGLEAGRCDLVVEAPGHGCVARRGVVVEAGRVGTVDFVLPARPDHVGLVVDAAGTPVAAAEVTVSYAPAGAARWRSCWAVRRVTESHGLFTFPPSGDPRFQAIDVRAHKDGVGDGSTRVGPNAPASVIETIHLGLPDSEPKSPLQSAAYTIEGAAEGVVVDGSGAPVAGASVGTDWQFAAGSTVATDEAGRFRVPTRGGRIGARLRYGPVTWSAPVQVPYRSVLGGITLVIATGPALAVEVIGTDGLRTSGVTIVVDDDGDEPAHLVGRTDAKGRAEFASVDSDWVVVGVDPASLPAGTCVDDDFNPVVWVKGLDRPPVLIRLRPEILLRGTLILEDGSPVAHASVGFATVAASPSIGLTLDAKIGMLAANDKPSQAQKFCRSGVRGDFTLRVASLNVYEPIDITRIVLEPPEFQIFFAVRRVFLSPDAENKIVVRRVQGR